MKHTTSSTLLTVRSLGIEKRPIYDAYRLLYSRELYDKRYGLDERAMTLLFDDLSHNRYVWQQPRPATLDTGRVISIPERIDRALGHAIKSILAAYFEPSMADTAFGFIDGKGPRQCIRALRSWSNVAALYHLDISGCFPSIKRAMALQHIALMTRDRRFLALVADGIPDSGLLTGDVFSPVITSIILRAVDAAAPRHFRYIRYADNILFGLPRPTILPDTYRVVDDGIDHFEWLVNRMGFALHPKPADLFLGARILLIDGCVTIARTPGMDDGYARGLGL